ncbi:unnamed protein product [Taenia asiatica]|uniref:Uridylate-specific endoribonuclease n=1 Tax=Taenia asiatica TaxID=60517 RepID=A0A0R3VXS6_TAEAS|nr:unnamed protein product [Taenia asiatica]
MHDSFKALGTMLIGSSVEFEFGLYTTIFLRAREVFWDRRGWPPFRLMLEDKKVLVQCHPKDEDRMGSCYFMDQDLIHLVSEIWDADPNRLKIGKDLKLDWQGIVNEKDSPRDVAPKPLFKSVSKCLKGNEVAKGKFNSPTFLVLSFISLLDNYEHRVGFSEVETPEEKAEIQRFLDAVLGTPTMRSFHAYLSKRKLQWDRRVKMAVNKYISNVICSDLASKFSNFVYFHVKRRGDSSPFEHVFVGETKQKNVLGMHSWITFCLNEKEGIVDYYGYNRPVSN